MNFERPLDSLNYFSQTGYVHTEHKSLVFDHLLEEDPVTGEFKGSLAKHWEISKDGKTLLFRLRKGAKFHDGKPVTAEDVKFSFECHQNPSYKSIHNLPFVNEVKVEAVDAHTIRLVLPRRSAVMLRALGSWPAILPRHYYSDLANESQWAKQAIGSGPYKVVDFSPAKKVEYARNDEWWGFRAQGKRGRYNFPRITFRFITDIDVATEMLKNGELHFVRYFDVADFAKLAESPAKNAGFHAVRTKLMKAKGSRRIRVNMRKSLFADPEVRVALLEIFDRRLVNEKLYRNTLLPGISYWHQDLPDADPNVKPIPYDPHSAAKRFRRAGWQDSDGDGVLDKTVGGEKTDFRFTILYYKPDASKLLTLYKEAAKKAGIDIELRQQEAQAVFRLDSDAKYDAIYMQNAFSDLNTFPYDELHSRFIEGKSASNARAYRNTEVDKLLEASDAEYRAGPRRKILRKAYRLIANDPAELQLFDDAYYMYGVTARVKRSQDALPGKLGWDRWSWR